MTAYDVAAHVLDVVAAGLTDAGVDVPERRYVAPGPLPAWDCEQLTVALVRPAVPGTPGREVARSRPCGGPRFVEVRVELVRCAPVGDGEEPATVEELTACAQGLSADVEALRKALDDPVALVGRPGPTTLVGPVTTTGPEGGLVAVGALVQVPL